MKHLVARVIQQKGKKQKEEKAPKSRYKLMDSGLALILGAGIAIC